MINTPDTSKESTENASESLQDVTKLKVGDLLRQMTPAQLWTLLGSSVTVLIASFLLGFVLNSWHVQGSLSKSTSDIAKREIDIAGLKSNLADSKAEQKRSEREHDDLKVLHEQLKAKENFLRVYYLYSRAQWNMDYLQTHLSQIWRGLDIHIRLKEPESPARRARAMSGDSFPTEKFPTTDELHAIHVEYKQLASERRNVNRPGAQIAFDHFGPSIDSLEKATADRDRYRTGLKTLLDEQRSSAGYEVTFGHFAKGVTDVGVVKFAYDGTEVPLPNEFFPEPSW